MRRVTKAFALMVLTAAVALSFAMPAPARAGEPTELVKETVEDIIAIVTDESLKGDEKTEERREQMREVIRNRFGFTEMAMRSMGRHWRDLSPDEQKEFTEVFARVIENSYIDKVEGYTDEEVAFDEEKTVRNMAMVGTRIILHSGTEIPIEYRMVKRGSDWRVYDVVIEGVSLVRNYRTQFGTALRKGSYTELVAQLKEKL